MDPMARGEGALASGPSEMDAARANGLERLAGGLEGARGAVIAVCAEETALLPAELEPEFDRMTGTLRLMAAEARSGAWAGWTADPAPVPPAKAVGPGHALRLRRVPLGPVAVFGASNFPLAYGVCGGDTASALAVGCPVVVKEHPAHPKTGRRLAEIAHAALADLPEGVFGYVEQADPADTAVGAALVGHPVIKAAGFTGSARGGLALEAAARSRAEPIPVFAEMGSVNPVFITPGALASATRAAALADEIAGSLLLRFGQQCTCPGVVFVPECAGADALVARLAERVRGAAGRRMLAAWIAGAYAKRVAEARAVPGGGVRVLAEGAPAIGPGGGTATLLEATPEAWRAHAALREEIFGPAMLVVRVGSWREAAALPIPGSLTLTVRFDERDEADRAAAWKLIAAHGGQAGRIIAHGVPTGVRVSPAMVHGGPFPATNCPETTAVGPAACLRWTRPVCFQGFGV